VIGSCLATIAFMFMYHS